ncbi:hypothetical protein ACS0TY_021207 [Phlomoides rotata]
MPTPSPAYTGSDMVEVVLLACNPMAWTVYGVVASQLGDLNAQVAVLRLGFMTAKEYLKQNFGFDHHFLHVVAIMLLVFIIMFVFVFAYDVKSLNYQRR